MTTGWANYPKLSFGKPAPKKTPAAPGLHIYSDPEVRAIAAGIVSKMPMPQTAGQINTRVKALPAPMNNTQIQSQAQGMLDPVVQRLTASTNAQTQSGLGAIKGYTDALAGYFQKNGPAQVNAAYAPAEAATAATNAALSDRLAGAGNDSSDALAARLQSINNPAAVDPAVAAVRQAGVGAGNATFATGNASLEQLIGNAAHEQEYVGKMPGIAREGGLQQVGQYEQSQGRALSDQVGTVQQQLPSIVQALRGQSDQRAQYRAATRGDLTDQSDALATNRVNAGTAVNNFYTGQNTTREVANEGFAGKVAAAAGTEYAATVKASAPKLIHSGSDVYSLDPTTGKVSPVVTHPPKVDASPTTKMTSKGLLQYDPSTNSWGLIPGTAPAGKTTAKTGGLSASGWRSLVSDASKQASTLATAAPAKVHYPAGGGDPQPIPGSGHDATSYKDALAQIVALGPNTPAWHAKAAQIVNAQYSEGESGRPYSPKNAKRTAAQAAAAAVKAGKPYQEAVDTFLANTQGTIDPAVARAAYERAYFFPPISPIKGVPQPQPGAVG